MKKSAFIFISAFISSIALTIDRSLPLATSTDLFARLSGNGMAGLFVLLGIIFLYYYFWDYQTEKVICKASLILACLFAGIEALGYNINQYASFFAPNASRLFSLIDLLVMFAGYFLLFKLLLKPLLTFLLKISKKPQGEVSQKIAHRVHRFLNKKWAYPAIMVLFLLAWLPYFILLYPGVATLDSFSQLNQALEKTPLNDHHPLSHTLLLKGPIRIGIALFGSAYGGTVVCSISQMLILSALFTLVIYLLKNTHWIVILFSFLLFAFHPVIAWYSVTIWKDIIFSAFLLLYGAILVSCVLENKNTLTARTILLFFIATLGVLMFKKSGIYIIILTVFALAILLKTTRKQVLFASLLALMCYGLFYAVAFNVFNAEKGDTKEALSIPLQQIACTVKEHGNDLSEEEKDAISELLPYNEIARLYTPTCSNNIKDNFDSGLFLDNPPKYIKTYFTLGAQYPVSYLKSFLCGTCGYWYPETKYWVVSSSSYLDTILYYKEYGWESLKDINFSSYQQNLKQEEFQEDALDLLSGLRNTPGLSLFFSIGFWVWIYIILIAVSITRHDRALIPLYVFIGAIYLTCLISPVYAEMRYAFALLLLIPIVCAAATRPSNTSQQESTV